MVNNSAKHIRAIAKWMFLFFLVLRSTAQPTVFNYQGQLGDGGQPANGIYDLSFTLYDAVTNGNVVATLTNAGTPVANGMFSVPLDYGAGIFNGSNYWIEVAVQTNGGSGFVPLSPRQLIVSVPYATYSASAGTAAYALAAANAGAVSATNISGSLPDSVLSSNVALLNASPNFTGTVSAGAVSAGTFSGNGMGLTNVPGTLFWQVIAGTNQQMFPNQAYLYTNNSKVTFTLPMTANPGDSVYIAGTGSNGWRLAQNAGQSVRSPNQLTSYSTWTNTHTPSLGWSSVACSTDGTKIVAVGINSQQNNLVTSTDSGNTWRTNSLGLYLYDVVSSSDGSKLVTTPYTYSYNTLYFSSDSGASWTGQSISPAPSQSVPIRWLACSADGTKLYASGTFGYVMYSPDSGADWITRNTISASWTSLACSVDGSFVVAGSSGSLYTSSNFGANWTQRSSVSGAVAVACSTDGSKIVAAVANGPIYTSSDSGVTWTVQNSGNQQWTAIASSSDGTRLMATVSNGTVYSSVDSGVTWIPQNSGTRNWTSVASSADGTKLVATVNSGQIWTSRLGTVASTTPGVNGAIFGQPYSSAQLLYVANGIWTVISLTGTVVAF
jgi:hypothetical protein